MKKIKKNIILDDLAGMMQSGFIRVEKSTDKKIDNLAGMVQRGFLDVSKRFDEVDKRFDLLEAEMNARFDQLEKIIFHEYKNRIEKLEGEVKELQADFRQLVGFKK